MIDWTRVEELRREVGEDDFPEVVEIFLEEVNELFERLPEAAQNGTLAEDLHFLKGSAASLGFVGLSALCETGEQHCALGTTADFCVDRLHSGYESERREFLAGLTPAAA